MDYKDDYNLIEDGEDAQKSLSSYSDLFVAISFVFLFLFIAASLQGGIQQILSEQQKELDRAKAKEEIEAIKQGYFTELQSVIDSYEQKLAFYEARADSYSKQSDPKDIKEYKQTITSLEEVLKEAQKNKEQYLKLFKDYQDKEAKIAELHENLKHMVKSNLVVKDQIDIKKEEVAKIQEDYTKELKESERKIASVKEAEFNEKVEVVKNEFEQEKKAVVKEYDEKITQVQTESQEKIKEIREKSQQELAELKEKLNANYQKELNETRNELNSLMNERTRVLSVKLNETQSNYQAQLENKENQIKSLNQMISQSEQQINETQAKLAMSQKSKGEATKNISEKLKNAFSKEKIDVEVDDGTGEVTLNFKEAYFDLGKHDLKPAMVEKLKQVVPVYAKTIMNDPGILDRIEYLEVIGYASPIFGAKYVDPEKLNEQNFWAINYNMDLSYRRAKSVFNYVFHPKKLPFKYKKKMYKMTKLSGRSFIEGRKLASVDPKKKKQAQMDMEQYCKKYRCNEQQKIVIRFALKY